MRALAAVLAVVAAFAAPVATAAPKTCVTLPGAVPEWADAHTRNPRLCPPPVVAPTYTLRTTDSQVEPIVWKTSYSVNDTYDVYLALDVVGAITGSSALQLEINMPGGLPYQVFNDSLTGSSGTPIAGGVRIWKSLLVAGTLIQQAALYGSWTATAIVQESDGSLHTASTAFELTAP